MATLTMHVEAGWLRLLLLLNLLHQKDLKPPGEESNYLWDLQMKQCLRADFDLQNLLTHPLRREKVLLLGKERVKAMESNITDLPKIGWGGQTERCACWQPGTGDITHLWKVQDFVLELDNLGKLQAARPDSKVCEAILDNFCTRLSAIQEWTSQNVLEIMDQVGSMALPETWKDKILEQLDLLGSHMQSHLRLQATPQRVSNLAAYLTEEEWSKLSQCSNHEAMQVLAQGMKHLGMVSLKESSKREAIALLLHMQVDVQQKPEPSSKMVKSLVNDFADLFKRMPAPPGAPASLPTYPPDPTALPAEFRMKAYPGQPPANKQVILRKGHLSLKEPEETPKAGSVARVPGTSLETQLLGLLERWVQPSQEPRVVYLNQRRASNDQQVVSSESLSSGHEHASQLALPAPPSPSPKPPLPLPSTPAESAVNKEDCKMGNDSSTADLAKFEEEAFQALAAKAKAKKGKGSPSVGSTKPMKRPSACPKVKNAPARTKFGCPRCRGALGDCSVCIQPTYKGIRLAGREAWKTWYAAKQAKSK
eukprot:s314_g3.t1